MVNLSFIQQNVSRKIPSKAESKIESIQKLTHLYMHNNYIQKIGDLSACKNLKVLYLHNNLITDIQNLHTLKKLKHLYLQKNYIEKIEGLECLQKLKKLYIGYNKISVIEKLEYLCALEELHMEKQDLIKGESLCFDPRTIINLADNLLILNISNNNMTSIKELLPLRQLKILKASYNNISDYSETANILTCWYQLTDADFTGNPMTKLHRYRETIIANTFRLAILDNKEINATTRDFIKRFEHEKSVKRPITSEIIEADIAGDIAPPIRKAVSKSIVKSFSQHCRRNLSNTLLTTSMSEGSTEYLPWKALKSRDSFLKSTTQKKKQIIEEEPKEEETKKERKKVHFTTVFPTFPS